MQEEKQMDNGITLIDLINMLFRNIFLILAITVGITVIGVIYTLNFVEPTYVSKSDIMVQIDKTDGGTSPVDFDIPSSLRLVQTVSEFLQKDRVLQEVIKELELDITPSALKKNLRVSFSVNHFFVNVQYESDDPVLAGLIVNSVIENAIIIANDEFPVLNNTMIQVGEAGVGSYSSPNKPLNVIISVLLGGVLGVVTALSLEAFKTTIRNKKELEQFIPEYQVIGLIPEISDRED